MADKTYILDLKSGNQRRVTVPEDWKVTFGPLIPNDRTGRGTLALRFYENKEKQRAIFTDVCSFRASDIPTEVRSSKVKRKTYQKQTKDGVKDFVVEAKVTEWVDPDVDGETAETEYDAIEDFSLGVDD